MPFSDMKDGEILWHALDIEEVLRALSVDPTRGLSEHQVWERQREFGPNVFGELKGPSALELLAAQFRSLVVFLLLVAAAVSLVVGENLDALAILAAVLINVLIGFVTESRAEQALQALRELSAPAAHVLRHSEESEIPAKDLVPGDIIILSPGSRVPADARIVEETNLTVNEALLTGESDWVEKHSRKLPPETPLTERRNMVYLGTVVTEGHGVAVVTATGIATEVGRIGRLIIETPHEAAPLERAVEGLGRRLVWAILGTVALVFLVGLWHNEPPLLLIETAITLAIAAVPEGLPAVTTVALAFGLRSLVKRNAIVRRLPVVETLGSTTVICADKTGTLTEGVMTVRLYAFLDRAVDVTGTGYEPKGCFISDGREIDPAGDNQLRQALLIGALCNNATLELDPDIGWHVHGDAGEAALLVAAAKAGLAKAALVRDYPRVGEVPFDEATKRMVTFNQMPDGRTIGFAKGAPEVILPMSREVLAASGPRPMTPDIRAAIEQRNRLMAQRGLRVMALAYCEIRSSQNAMSLTNDLTFVALVGMSDPPRASAKEAIARCHRAGIRTIMITGDQLATAIATAEELDLGGGEPILGFEARDLPDLSAEAGQRLLKRVSVFARVAPKDKLLIVQALQKQDEIVAMTGDGVNDAPALRAAHIGIALGRRSADVAKEAAHLIITDDNFATIVAAIEQGRIIYSNIRRAIRFLLTASFSAILVVLMAIPLDLGLPLLPLQILYLNVIVHSFPAIGLALEPGSPTIMEEPPRDPREPLLPARLLASIIWRTVLIAAAVTAAFVSVQGLEPSKPVTIAFAALALALLLHMFNSRSERFLLWNNRHGPNPYVWLAFAAALALQLAGLYAPGLQNILRTTPLRAAEWAVVVAAAVVPALLVEISKLLWPVEFKKRQGWHRNCNE